MDENLLVIGELYLEYRKALNIIEEAKKMIVDRDAEILRLQQELLGIQNAFIREHPV